MGEGGKEGGSLSRAANAEAAEKWLKKQGVEPSELGVEACVLLGLWQRGFHHIQYAKLVNWAAQSCIVAFCDRGMATVDDDSLTRLVFLAHDECLRVEITGPRTGDDDEDDDDRENLTEPPTGYGFQIKISPRQREGEFYEVHPTLEQAVEQWRDRNPESGVLN